MKSVQAEFFTFRDNDHQIIGKYLLEPLDTSVLGVFCDGKRRKYLPESIFFDHIGGTLHSKKVRYHRDQLNYGESISKVGVQNEPFIFVSYSVVEALGCSHYLTGVSQYCSVCNSFYKCRFCHNESVEDHRFDRFSVLLFKCNVCEKPFKKDELTQICECGTQLFAQSCRICNQYVLSDFQVKPFSHCDRCGQCSVGEREFVQHCDQCGSCIQKPHFADHRCVDLRKESCIVCLEEFGGSNGRQIFQPCGHPVHARCYQQLRKISSSCPLCRRSNTVGAERAFIVRRAQLANKQRLLPSQFAAEIGSCACAECGLRFNSSYQTVQFCPDCSLPFCERLDFARKLPLRVVADCYKQCYLQSQDLEGFFGFKYETNFTFDEQQRTFILENAEALQSVTKDEFQQALQNFRENE